MKLMEALHVKEKEVVALVGGGGKTTLMYALAKELAAAGSHVVTTTTTKIAKPANSDTDILIIEGNPCNLLERVGDAMRTYRHITVVRQQVASVKLAGFSVDTVTALAGLPMISNVIVEADGAARHSLKAPADYEPVIPSGTSLVIAVAGLDAVGRTFEEGTVFRSELAAKLLGIPLGTMLTPEIIARLIALPRGITKGSPVGARIIPFLNKIDIENGLDKGRQVARAILDVSYPRIKTVLMGRAQVAEPVSEVITY